MNTDPHGRTIDYLRISVTDRCNERCLYCMPEGYKGWAQRPDHMTANEIILAVEAAAMLGFRKFRITGGEPLIRTDIVEIAQRIWSVPGVETLGLSTNGSRLADMARELKQSGIRSVNISLDALDADLYRKITGGELRRVLSGIEAALDAGFEIIKLNCVLLRGVNEDQYLPLIRFAAARAMPLRFIELMPVSVAIGPGAPGFLSVQELMARIASHGTLVPMENYRPGHGPAKYHQFSAPGLPGSANLGFIGALTTPHFCETCNKLRLTADGKLRPCLGRHGEINLLDSLRAGSDIGEALRNAIANKPENHEFLECYKPDRPMIAIGG